MPTFSSRSLSSETRRSIPQRERFSPPPQSVIFEIAYVLQSQYGLTGQRLASTVRAVVAFPGLRIVDDCSWKRVLEIWPETLPGLADAAIVTVAAANRYEVVATFDWKLSNRLKAFGLAAYW